MNGIEQLCPACGLCCDSTLFADVELRAGDDAKKLRQLGFSLIKKERGKTAFAQPCVAFDGKLCGIYADRPQRCRAFECGLLKRVEADEMTVKTALKKISIAKLKAENVRTLLQQMGNHETHTALTHRYAETMSAPVDFSDENAADRHGELMLAVNDLMQLLQRDFLQ
jgi:Fe-S-cluster containining protein